MLRKTVLSLKSPTGAFIVPLRFTNAKFFKDKTNREIRAYFAYALEFLEGRQRPDTFLSAVVHMDEKTPHLHLCFVPLTADGRLSTKEIIGNRKNLVKWQDEFWPVSYTHLYKRKAFYKNFQKSLDLFNEKLYTYY